MSGGSLRVGRGAIVKEMTKNTPQRYFAADVTEERGVFYITIRVRGVKGVPRLKMRLRNAYSLEEAKSFAMDVVATQNVVVRFLCGENVALPAGLKKHEDKLISYRNLLLREMEKIQQSN